jgi:hypothetical protein
VTTGRAKNNDEPVCTFCPPDAEHSGQWNPTDAVLMHDGQMWRSHLWHLTPASRSGCR